MNAAAKPNPKLPLLNLFFWSIVGGIVFAFAMTIYTAVQNRSHQRELETAAKSMPLPADAPAQAKPIVPAN